MSAYALYRQLCRLRKSIRQQQYTILNFMQIHWQETHNSACFGYTDFFKPINGKYYYLPNNCFCNPNRNKVVSYKFVHDRKPDAGIVNIYMYDIVPYYKFLYKFKPQIFTQKFLRKTMHDSISDVGIRSEDAPCINIGIRVLRFLRRNFNLSMGKGHDFYLGGEGDVYWEQIRINLEYLMKHNIIKIPLHSGYLKSALIDPSNIRYNEICILNFKYALWLAQFLDRRSQIEIFGAICGRWKSTDDEMLLELKEYNERYKIV